MKRSMAVLILLGLISPPIAAAVKVVQCEDENGNRTFQRICPPGSTQVSEKSLSTGGGPSSSEDESAIHATLYSIPICETCKTIREYLQQRQVVITEKNVDDNVELQNELTKLAGVLKVPVTVIGAKVISGYKIDEIQAALTAAGYTEPAAEEEAGEEETGEEAEPEQTGDETATEEETGTEETEVIETEETEE